MAFRVKHCVRIVLGFSSAVIGMYFLSKSSFSELQLSDDGSTKATAFSFLTALFIVFLFVGPDLKNFVINGSRNHFVMRSLVTSFSFVIVFVLVFLIKHPRFNIHSEYTRPCVAERRNEISHGVEYNLFSLIAFSALASITSCKRKEPSQLGFFGNLLGLIIDTCMEINGDDGPILFYIFIAGLCCVLLIFLRCYAETSNNILGTRKFQILTILELVLASSGIILLSLGSFSKMQFEGSPDLKVACFSIFALLLGSSLWKLPNWIDILVSVRRNSRIATATVNSLLLMLVSLMIFLNKFPRFKLHSEYAASCPVEETFKITHGRLFDLCSAATFAFFALVVSTPLDGSHELELGMFSFLLQLTMDVAIETLENRAPNAFYMLGAFVYCVALIFLKTWLSGRGSGNGAAGESGPGPSGSGIRIELGGDTDQDNELSELGGDSPTGWNMVTYDPTFGAGDAAAGESSGIQTGVGCDTDRDNVSSELGGDSPAGWDMVANDAAIGVGGFEREERRNYSRNIPKRGQIKRKIFDSLLTEVSGWTSSYGFSSSKGSKSSLGSASEEDEWMYAISEVAELRHRVTRNFDKRES